MATLATLNVELMASAARFKANMEQAGKALNDFSSKTKRMAQGVNSTFKSIEGAVFSLQGAMVGLGAVGVGALIKQADAFNQLQAKIKNSLSDVSQFEAVFRELQASSNRSGAALDSVAQGFVRINGSARALGYTNQQVIQFNETFAKMGALAGNTSDEVGNAMIQISQGIASGRLQGDELKTVLESMPAVGRAIAESMGISFGELRKAASEGKVTAVEVLDAIIGKTAEVDAAFGKLPPSVSRSFTQIQNNANALLGELNNTFNATGAVAGMMNQLATSTANASNYIAQHKKQMQDLAAAIAAAAIGIGGTGGLIATLRLMPALIATVGAAIAGLDGFLAGLTARTAILTGGLTVLAGALSVVAYNTLRTKSIQEETKALENQTKAYMARKKQLETGQRDFFGLKYNVIGGAAPSEKKALQQQYNELQAARKKLNSRIASERPPEIKMPTMPSIRIPSFSGGGGGAARHGAVAKANTASIKQMNQAWKETDELLRSIGINPTLTTFSDKMDEWNKSIEANRESVMELNLELSPEANARIDAYREIIGLSQTDNEKLQEKIAYIRQWGQELGLAQATVEAAVANVSNNVQESSQNSLSSVKDSIEELQQVTQNFGRNFEDAFINAAMTGKFAFKDLIASILEDLARATLRMAVINPLVAGLAGKSGGGGGGLLKGIIGGIAGAFGGSGGIDLGGSYGGFANGGITPTNKPFWVGENGPELMTTPRPMNVIPNHDLGGLGGGNSQPVMVTQHFNFTGDVTSQTRAEVARMAPKIMEDTKKALYQEIRTGGTMSKLVGRRA